MNIPLKPATRSGQYSLAALAGMVFFILLLNTFVALGEEGPDINYYLLIPAACGFLSGVLALAFGLVAIISQRERSILVFIATLIGLLMLIFALGEAIFPH
ncbi:MAG: hypothetical protein ACYC5A_06960 [Thermoleophilia bacterium]